MSEDTIMAESPLFTGAGFFPWWLVLLQGIVALVLGILFLSWPYYTLMIAVTFLGAYWFVSGLFALIGLATDRSHAAVKILLGVLGIIAGIVILAHPLFSTVLIPSLLVILIGLWGVIMGVVSLFAAYKGGGAGAAALGIIGLILGLVLVANPYIAVALMPFILGIFGVIGGLAAIVTAIAIRAQSGKGGSAPGA
ncbi:MAG TPA: DUF308 domain-containing protein [Methanoregulaceae archaeon]|nr:DUF308 domain-containing protein [Methanoregulaceae archaeon]HPQ76246.1 DUF308 domain-containing protein [Methanoregulaceae archaeon]